MLIWGWRAQSFFLVVTSFVCRYCQREAPQRLSKRVTRFTLFFIPLFVTSTRYSVQCVHCGAAYQVGDDYAKSVVEWSERRARGQTVEPQVARKTASEMPPPKAALGTSVVEVQQMKRLMALHADGVLSLEEFNAARTRLLASPSVAPGAP